MTTFRFLTTGCCLILWILILPQCSDKSSSEDYYREGLAQIEEQDYSGAESSFQKAINKNPKNPYGHYGLGGMYNLQKKYDLAEKEFLIALRMDPTFIDAHYSLGYTYEQLGQKEKAEKHFSVYRRLKKKKDRIMEEEKKTP